MDAALEGDEEPFVPDAHRLLRHRVRVGIEEGAAARLRELAPLGVAVVSLWPGLVLTERTSRAKAALPSLDFAGAESQRFTGRAVAALAADPKRMERSGRAWSSRELADAYGFTDVDGSLPKGPLHDRPGGPRAGNRE